MLSRRALALTAALLAVVAPSSSRGETIARYCAPWWHGSFPVPTPETPLTPTPTVLVGASWAGEPVSQSAPFDPRGLAVTVRDEHGDAVDGRLAFGGDALRDTLAFVDLVASEVVWRPTAALPPGRYTVDTVIPAPPAEPAWADCHDLPRTVSLSFEVAEDPPAPATLETSSSFARAWGPLDTSRSCHDRAEVAFCEEEPLFCCFPLEPERD
ncbi:MAG: hypothetical protein KC635_22740, partial [Myxococcales bacterium]|nr:hypothetical protein [Myxococcales bacterium]